MNLLLLHDATPAFIRLPGRPDRSGHCNQRNPACPQLPPEAQPANTHRLQSEALFICGDTGYALSSATIDSEPQSDGQVVDQVLCRRKPVEVLQCRDGPFQAFTFKSAGRATAIFA